MEVNRQVVVDAGCVMAVPDRWTDVEAAGFMETTLTAFLNVFQIGGAKPGDSVLIHGGGSGVGTQAAALCKARGITSFVTCGRWNPRQSFAAGVLPCGKPVKDCGRWFGLGVLDSRDEEG